MKRLAVLSVCLYICLCTTLVLDIYYSQLLRPTQPPIQWVLGALSLGLKRPDREADHTPLPSVEVKECVYLYLNSPIRLNGVALS
jgi:hypothetical protein